MAGGAWPVGIYAMRTIFACMRYLCTYKPRQLYVVHGLLTRCVKLRVVHAPGKPGDPGMHHGTKPAILLIWQEAHGKTLLCWYIHSTFSTSRVQNRNKMRYIMWQCTCLTCHWIWRARHTWSGSRTFKFEIETQSKYITMVSCQKGPTRHAYAWQIGPFWQDALELSHHVLHTHWRCFKLSPQSPSPPLAPVIHRNLNLKKQNKKKKNTQKNKQIKTILLKKYAKHIRSQLRL